MLFSVSLNTSSIKLQYTWYQINQIKASRYSTQHYLVESLMLYSMEKKISPIGTKKEHASPLKLEKKEIFYY
jgi:hypothetical protein